MQRQALGKAHPAARARRGGGGPDDAPARGPVPEQDFAERPLWCVCSVVHLKSGGVSVHPYLKAVWMSFADSLTCVPRGWQSAAPFR